MTAPSSAVQPPNRRDVALILRQIVGAAGAVTGPRERRMRHAILEAAKAIEQGRDPDIAMAAVYQSKPKPENN
jgi:hypothetical protein